MPVAQTIKSANDTLLSDGGQWNWKRGHPSERRSKVEVEVICRALAMAEAEILIGLIFTIFYRPLQLEVASWGFLDTPEEVKSVAATGCVELGL